MATVVRLKRRRNEDPLEALLLATKRRKDDSGASASECSDDPASLFKFAGTVNSKVDGISRHVREAIRKDKLEREFRHHQADIVGNVRSLSRSQATQKSQQNRFRVISKYRAEALDALDNEIKDSEATVGDQNKQENNIDKCTKCDELRDQLSNNAVSAKCSCKHVTFNDKDTTNVNVENTNLKTSTDSCAKGETSGVSSSNTSSDNSCASNTGQSEGEATGQARETSQTNGAEVGSSRTFNLVDIVAEDEDQYISPLEGAMQADQITCNSQPMVREVVSERPLPDDDYVYDIYYTNSQQFDFRLFERDLTFEAFNRDLLLDRDDDEVDDRLVYGDDDDDENDEGNWRNDYPDEDPHLVDERPGGYDYDHDLDEYVAFETETGNQLADWMSWRCNIDGNELSSDDDVDPYNERGSRYEAYYRHVKQEIAESD